MTKQELIESMLIAINECLNDIGTGDIGGAKDTLHIARRMLQEEKENEKL